MPDKNDFPTKIQNEIQELAESIRDVVDKFRELKNPLAESNKKVPMATEQLDKINEQTEVAAHQMLDKIEQITQREEEVIQGLNRIKELTADLGVADLGTIVDDLTQKASTTVNDAYTIMDALQFQDITSQQMSHAVSLLEDVQDKLGRVVIVLHDQKMDFPESIGDRKNRRVRSFDPNADMFNKKTDQAEIDDLVSRKSKS
jgi:chemotaxis regulatin CheY-phosphate phosphatase CheZ